MKFSLILLLLTLPLHATAQGRLHAPDPEPMTYGCQSPQAGFLPDGDIVMVDYHGTWKRWEEGNYSQNGGVNNAPCEVRRVFRMSLSGQLKWEITQDDDVLRRGDKVTGIATMPDGKVVVTLTDAAPLKDQRARVLLLGNDGRKIWMKTTANKSRFIQATPLVDQKGGLVVKYHATNYGYDGGYLSIDGSKITPIKSNSVALVFARLEPKSGDLIWEKKGDVVDLSSSGILVYDVEQNGVDIKHNFSVFDMNGNLKTKPIVVRLVAEYMTSAQIFQNHLVVTLAKENGVTEDDPSVSFRDGRLMAFTMAGERVATRRLSDGAKLAKSSPSAPLRVMSPDDCDRGIVGGLSCHTSSLSVITFESVKEIEEGGAFTRLTESGHVFSYDDFHAESTKGGLYFSAKTFTGDSPKEAGPGVLAGFSLDEERARVTAKVHVWKPIKVKPPELKLGF